MALLVALAACCVGCAGDAPGSTPTGDRVFVVDPVIIQIRPQGTGSARFVLTSGGVPIAGQTVNFTIPDDVEAKGATLVNSSAVTDGAGAATVEVRAGDATMFYVQATAGGPPTTLVVVVAVAAGSVLVAPFFAPGSNAAAATLSIDVRLFDNARCADINLANPPLPPRGDVRSLPPSGGTVLFNSVSTKATSAVVGRALGGHGAIAIGCVDLLGSSLVPDGVVEVALQLRDTVLTPVGHFTIASQITFAPPLAAAALVAAPWRDLGDCPLDPAQLFLDCMIDALSPATATDPLNCKPSAVPGAEGPLGDALGARRGVLITDAGGVVTSCRGPFDTAGRSSLDAIVMGLFGSPTPPLVVALPAMGTDAARIFDRVALTSSLDVRSSGPPNEYVVTHSLLDASFPLADPCIDRTDPLTPTLVDLAQLALPAATAYTTATTRDGVLIVDDHGFSLRLGRIARVGFGGAVLAPPLGVTYDPTRPAPTAGDLIAALAALARSDDGGGASGCLAIDRALCAAVGSAPGCLATACPAGLTTLATSLDASFDAADGQGLDLYLAGTAPMTDLRDDGSADELGRHVCDHPNANWEFDLRTAGGRARLTPAFYGMRDGN